MEKKPGKISFNKQYAKSVTEAEFIKNHKHHEKDYDLKAEYVKLVDKPVKADK